jgi:hypothetical protein
MRSLWDELRIIPRIVWPIALLVTCGTSLLFYFMRPRMAKLSAVETVFVVWGALFLFAWVVLIGYINVDARRRGMHYITWTLLSICIPNFIGAILYFVLRDPMLLSCPKCGAKGRSIFVFCPQCGSELAPACPDCKRAVELSWNRCVYCGKELDQTVKDPLLQSR